MVLEQGVGTLYCQAPTLWEYVTKDGLASQHFCNHVTAKLFFLEVNNKMVYNNMHFIS
jgi:hypothetical protein